MISFVFKAFGFSGYKDFYHSTFKIFIERKSEIFIVLSTILASVRSFFETAIGLDVMVYIAFALLIYLETQTGIKVAYKIKNERFKSRKFGRMLLKLGTYTQILFVLKTFSNKIHVPEILGFDVNPFIWVYYFFLIAIIFQMLISYLENLSALGYNEMNNILGTLLRKYNKWFEFDGSKNPDNE